MIPTERRWRHLLLNADKAQKQEEVGFRSREFRCFTFEISLRTKSQQIASKGLFILARLRRGPLLSIVVERARTGPESNLHARKIPAEVSWHLWGHTIPRLHEEG